MSGVELDNDTKTSIQLPVDGELCVAVPLGEPRCSSSITLQAPANAIHPPRVDILGAPMVPGVEYFLLPGQSLIVFSWTSAVVDIKGSAKLKKNIFRTGMKSIMRPLVEYQCSLDQMRRELHKKNDLGPIVLVCGSTLYGKRLAARSLCSYATRSGWKPLLVDLDSGMDQSVGIPGSIGAAIMEYPLVVDEIISQTHITFSYFTGFLESQQQNDLGASISPCYKHYSSLLMDVALERLQEHIGTVYGSSGAIVILPDLVGASGAAFVASIAERYPVSNILCWGDNYLFHKLYSRFDESGSVAQAAKVTKVDKISASYFGPFPVPPGLLLPQLYKHYFYGQGAVNLSPSSWTKELDKIVIYQIKERDHNPVLVVVDMKALQGIVGCLAALHIHQHSQSLLSASPLAFAKIDSIDAAGVHLLTTTHVPPPEHISAIVGAVRWITSS